MQATDHANGLRAARRGRVPVADGTGKGGQAWPAGWASAAHQRPAARRSRANTQVAGLRRRRPDVRQVRPEHHQQQQRQVPQHVHAALVGVPELYADDNGGAIWAITWARFRGVGQNMRQDDKGHVGDEHRQPVRPVRPLPEPLGPRGLPRLPVGQAEGQVQVLPQFPAPQQQQGGRDGQTQAACARTNPSANAPAPRPR